MNDDRRAPAWNIRVPIGVDYGLAVTVVDTDGEPVTPANVSAGLYLRGVLVDTISTAVASNVITVTLPAADVTDLGEGVWVWRLDAELDGTVTQLLTGDLRVEPAGSPRAGAPESATLTVGNDVTVQVSVSAFTGAFTPLRLSLNNQTASYTLVAGDEQKLVEMNVGSANDLTVPPESSVSWATGTQVHVVQAGSGQTTLTPGSGVTINGTPGLKTRAQWSTVTLIYRGSDVWLAVGDLAA